MGQFDNLTENESTYLEEIVEKLNVKKVFFFVGAGLSLGSGLPSWENLIKFLCIKYHVSFTDISDPHESNKGDYLQEKAQQVEEAASPQNIVNSINECFEQNRPSCGYNVDMQRLLVTIAARTSGVIFTTNYDGLLEQAADEEHIRRTVYAYPNLFSDELKDVLQSDHLKSDGSLRIFKIHGTVVEGEKVVLSNSSYDQAYSKSLIPLLTKLSDNDIFFLGCSFTDSYFGTEYRKRDMGKGKWYTFYPSLFEKNIENINIMSQKINVVKYNISDMSDNNQHNKNIKNLLDYLSEELGLMVPYDVSSNVNISEVRNNRTIKKIKLTKELGRDWCLARLSAVEEIICCKEINHIPNRAFFKCESLKKIRFEGEIIAIGLQAFDGCLKLEEIYFNNKTNEFSTLEQLGDMAFRDCAALVSVKFLDACKIDTIPLGCFQGCHSLTQIDFPKEIKKISDNAFRDCKSLQYFNFRYYSNLLEIGKNAFHHCCSLTAAYMSDSVMRIGGGAFQECLKLWTVRIPANLEKIEEYCFADCRDLESLTIIEFSKVRLVGLHAFQRCLSLRRITLPKSCCIEESAFMGSSTEVSFFKV